MLAGVGRFISNFSTPNQMADDPNKIVHLGQRQLPRFRFEYHPKSQKLFVVDIVLGERTLQPIANIVAYNVRDEGEANREMLSWCKGYFVGKEDRSHNEQGKIVFIGQHS